MRSSMKPRLTAVEPAAIEAMKLYEDSATVRPDLRVIGLGSNQLQMATLSDDAQSDDDWGVFPAQPRIWRICPAQPRDLAWY